MKDFVTVFLTWLVIIGFSFNYNPAGTVVVILLWSLGLVAVLLLLVGTAASLNSKN